MKLGFERSTIEEGFVAAKPKIVTGEKVPNTKMNLDGSFNSSQGKISHRKFKIHSG